VNEKEIERKKCRGVTKKESNRKIESRSVTVFEVVRFLA
jgi:hypothetical protein